MPSRPISIAAILIALAATPLPAAAQTPGGNANDCAATYFAVSAWRETGMDDVGPGRRHYAEIDFYQRAADVKGLEFFNPFDDPQIDANYQQILENMIGAALDGEPEKIDSVLDTARQCDLAYGLSPALGAKSGAESGAPSTSGGPASIPHDECAVRYYALALGYQANAQYAQGFLRRAQGAARKHRAAHPEKGENEILEAIKTDALARTQSAIGNQAVLMDLFDGAAACDIQYGLPQTKAPADLKGR